MRRTRDDGYEISTDPERLDRRVIHEFLRTAYWSPGVPYEIVDRAIDRSLPFGLYEPDGSLAGFARWVTDGATFGWLADVFVLEPHRGRGLGVWLVATSLEHPDLADARRLILATADAHSLYEKLGFERPANDRLMERIQPADELYRRLAGFGGGG